MDFVSGIKEIEADCYDEPPPRNWVEKFWAWLVSTVLFDSLTFAILIYCRRCNSILYISIARV